MTALSWKTWLRIACFVLLGAGPVAAQPTELFISEYIEGSSNNKALELYNGTGAPIDLAAGGYNIQIFFNGSVTPTATISLTGTVAAGDVYVVAHSSANAAILAQADQTTGSLTFNGDDAVVLRKGTTVIDAFGQVGLDPGTEWGSGLVSTADNTLRRKAAVCAGDANSADTFVPATEWDGYAVDTFDGFGTHTTNCAVVNAPVVATCGATLYVPVGTSATRNVTASDTDGTVTILDLTSVTPTPAAGTISRTAFTAASAVGGTATATVTVDSAVPAGDYAVLMTATNDDAQPVSGTCTLPVKVIAPKEIWEIQGSGAASPLVGQVVQTNDNIVTALGWSGGAYNGFFIQTPAARADGSAETSNGIFVFTSTPPTVQIGDQVDVAATVAEYFNMTELTTPTVTVDSSGHALPAVVLLGEIAPGVFVPSHNQPWPVNELERFEGMRVRVEEGRATAPTDSFGDLAIVAADTRAFREPGMVYNGGFSYPVVFDGNPEILEVNPDGAGLPNTALAAGSVIHVAEGPLAFSFSDYQIWPTTFTYTAATPLRAVRAKNPGELTLASQNMLRFFDTDSTNGPEDAPVTPAVYLTRLAKASLHIRTVLGAPDVVCLQEIENVGVLNDIVARIAADDPTLVYSAYLLEGRDVGGIDTGFLVRDTVAVDAVTQVGLNTTLSLDGSWLNDRPPLVLEARYLANGAPFPFTVIGIHGRSLSGIEGTADSANRVRQKRLEQALEIANYVQGLQAANPARRIVVLGDVNAYEFSDGYVDVVGVMTGSLDPNGAVQAGHADVLTPDLLSLVTTLPAAERYSFIFNGSAQAIDQALITQNLAAFARTFVFARGNADAPESYSSDPSTPLRMADHDGQVLFVMTDFDADGIPDDQEGPPPVGSDFTGDGKSDLLWWHRTLGEVWLWPMDGAAKTAESAIGTITDTNWEIRGQGDQDGNGTADLLWRNKTTGQIYFWPMNGSTPLGETYIDTVDPEYDIVGTGDYNGDGKSDILWRHLTNGDVWVWLMDGATTLSRTYIDTVDPGYVVQGSGDVNGDGRADLVWRHATGGDVWVWLMDGATPTVAYVDTVAELDYRIVGVADTTGDGKADLVWHHATRGDVWLWPMNGATVLSQSYIDSVPDTGYGIVDTGDYDGDGKADLLWHHATSGEVWVWLMDGTTKISETYVATVSGAIYQIVK